MSIFIAVFLWVFAGIMWLVLGASAVIGASFWADETDEEVSWIVPVVVASAVIALPVAAITALIG